MQILVDQQVLLQKQCATPFIHADILLPSTVLKKLSFPGSCPKQISGLVKAFKNWRVRLSITTSLDGYV